MLKIEWAINTPNAYTIERKGDVVLIDYAHWMTLDKATRQRLLEREHEMWQGEQLRSAVNAAAGMYQPGLTANEKNLADALEKMDGNPGYTAAVSEDGRHWQSAQAADLDDEVDYKQAFEECENELAEWRHLARRLEKAWYESFNFTVFGEASASIMKQLIDVLNKTDGAEPDKARMSVPDDDEDAEDARPPKGSKPDLRKLYATESETREWTELDHVIRAWDEKAQQVVYWRGRGWRPDITKAMLFTRIRALEIANSGNNVWPSYHVVNICAVSV